MNQIIEPFADLIMSISLDFKTGKITPEHYLSMIKLAISEAEKKADG